MLTSGLQNEQLKLVEEMNEKFMWQALQRMVAPSSTTDEPHSGH